MVVESIFAPVEQEVVEGELRLHDADGEFEVVAAELSMLISG